MVLEERIADHRCQNHNLCSERQGGRAKGSEQLLELDVVVVPETVEIVRKPAVNLGKSSLTS
jgi:hypothetical protein